MSDPLQSWLSLSRAVKDTSGSNAKWDSLARTQANQLNNFTFTMPGSDRTIYFFNVSCIYYQFNYSFPQPFTILNWRQITSAIDAAFFPVPVTLGIRYRHGTVATRYMFNSAGLRSFTGKIYNGQMIKPNFVLELWAPKYPGIGNRFGRILCTTTLTFVTSCQFLPTGISNLNADIPIASVAQGATQTGGNGDLFLALPIPPTPPTNFNAVGPFLDNV